MILSKVVLCFGFSAFYHFLSHYILYTIYTLLYHYYICYIHVSSSLLLCIIYIKDQLLSIITERLKDPTIRDCEDTAMLALSTHALSLTKAENSLSDMSNHVAHTNALLLKAKNKVAEKRKLEKLEEALKDGFVWYIYAHHTLCFFFFYSITLVFLFNIHITTNMLLFVFFQDI